MNRLLTLALKFEQDIVSARQRARQIASLLGFDERDQTRITTAVSEVARNAFVYAGGGKIEFMVESARGGPALVVRVSDTGPGIRDLEYVLSGRYQSSTGMGVGLVGAQRLMDDCQIRSEPDRGTEVTLTRRLSAGAPPITDAVVARLTGELAAKAPQSPTAELQQQNQELLRVLTELRERQQEMQRLNSELEDTNRGVVALYAELDEKADSLRRADDTKTRFLSNMSHEFRTPVNSIRALTRILLARTDGELNREQEKQMQYIARAAEDLGTLVDDLLDIAKIEAGKTEVHPGEFTVATMFSALRGMLRPLLVSESVRLVFEEPEGVPMLYTDEGKLAQILRNFISNALKFTELGEVRVKAEHLPAEGAVCFSVADTGVGIAPEDQERVFEEFLQVANPLQKRSRGTGLGLPLCRRLAALLGGRLTMKSELNVGSTFCVTVPLTYGNVPARQPAGAPAYEPTLPDAGPRLPTVLIIDDEESSRYVLGKLLSQHPVRVQEAADGITGLQRARALQPDLIFLDLKMPERDGSEVLVDLKQDPATRPIPVVMISTVSSEIMRLYDLTGAAAVVPKDTLTPETVRGLLLQAAIPAAPLAA